MKEEKSLNFKNMNIMSTQKVRKQSNQTDQGNENIIIKIFEDIAESLKWANK